MHHLDEALAEALVACRNKRDGDEPPASQAHASLPLHLGRGITPVDRNGDDELPSRQRIHVQKIKTYWNDKGLREILWQTVEAEGSWSACTRLHELTGPSVTTLRCDSSTLITALLGLRRLSWAHGGCRVLFRNA